MIKQPLLVLTLAMLAAPGLAAADDEDSFLVVDGTWIAPRGADRAADRVGAASGLGAELRFVPDNEAVTMSIGGFAALGSRHADGGGQARDVFDLHMQIGLKTDDSDDDVFIPYAVLGLDILHVATHVGDGDAIARGATAAQTLQGTTLGVSAQAGVLSHIGDRWLSRVSVGYLGAIAPGTGDDLGGVVVQLGLGVMIDD